MALKVTEVPRQNGFVSVEMKILAGKALLTSITIGADVAGLPEAQLAFEVTLQVTISPFEGVYENVGRLEPKLTPLTCH
jgi:hypothetical protein